MNKRKPFTKLSQSNQNITIQIIIFVTVSNR